MKEEFEKLYFEEGEAPWTFSDPDKEIVSLVENKVMGKEILEVGCGEGYHSIFLASKGFNVTSIDFSCNALRYARKHANESGVNCEFIEMDYRKISEIGKKFDFIFDWRFFHELIDEKSREDYIRNVKSLLKSDGKYLSVSFSGDSNLFGKGQLRKIPSTDVTLFFPTLVEAKELFGKYFEILKSKHINLPEKPDMMVKSNYLLMGN